MELDDIILNESARKDIYKVLSECFQVPNHNLDKRMDSLEKQLKRLSSGALDKVFEMRRDCQIQNRPHEDLQVDFSRLFIGPYNLLAPPYGSVYLEEENKIMGESTIDVIEKYQTAGVEISDNFGEAPDHISAELEFMSFLIFKEIETFQSETEITPQELLFQQNEFLQRHLGNWVKDLSDKMEQHAESNFYRSLAVATSIFVREDLEYLCSLEISEPAPHTMPS